MKCSNLLLRTCCAVLPAALLLLLAPQARAEHWWEREPIRILGEQSTLPVSCIPNAGLPLNVDGQAVYPLEPQPFAAALIEFVEKHHISVVGGCCGTTPDHIRAIRNMVDARRK